MVSSASVQLDQTSPVSKLSSWQRNIFLAKTGELVRNELLIQRTLNGGY